GPELQRVAVEPVHADPAGLRQLLDQRLDRGAGEHVAVVGVLGALGEGAEHGGAVAHGWVSSRGKRLPLCDDLRKARSLLLRGRPGGNVPRMKVFIAVDMEGATGVAHREHLLPGGNDYERARKWLTGDVNAAVEGAVAAGATDVYVNDGHG